MPQQVEEPVTLAQSDEAARPAAPTVTRKRGQHGRSGFLASVQSLVSTVVIAVFVITFVVQAFQIPSESMENTLLIGDYLLVDKVHFGQGGFWERALPYSEIGRGDILVFRWPVNPQQHFVKRVVGLPGDRVRISGKRVFVNGRTIKENYVVFKQRRTDEYRDNFPLIGKAAAHMQVEWFSVIPSLVQDGELLVPPDQYFVLGDNRDDSLDSRYWGLVPRESVVGRPLLIYWSLDLPSSDTPPKLTGDRLANLAYVLTHLPQYTRWERTFRLIK
jgi:signal peptidase I